MDAKSAKTIASIDINLVGSKEWLEESLGEHLNCVLCGDALRFKHKTDFVEQTVQEDAQCPSCNVRTRQNIYRLQ